MTAVQAEVGRPGQVDIVAVHAAAPRSRRDVEVWRRDLRALPRAPTRGRQRILAGDFNATLDHRELRNLLNTGYHDAAARVGAGLTPTWPSHGLVPPPLTLDHVLVDSRCDSVRVEVRGVAGTDHRALFAELVLPRNRR